MKFKPFAIVFLISLALLLAFFWIRAGSIELFSLSGLRLTSLVYGITYYILTVVLLRKFRGKLSPGVDRRRYRAGYGHFGIPDMVHHLQPGRMAGDVRLAVGDRRRVPVLADPEPYRQGCAFGSVPGFLSVGFLLRLRTVGQ